MKKYLDMTFRDSVGKEVTLSLPDPKDDLTLAQVNTAMDTIIAKNILVNRGSELVSRVEAIVRISDSVALV
ncbi:MULTISPECIES: DUF2922 domain-containing protein [Sporomusa]|uniref:DUF2922 domain-containing protein n=1 Tax=Sporomusa malonica TaxID=112901 RepID=A0A1W1Z878_9FIRM|nr:MULTISPECIES: DUF2922 domain-containing protein [Sporomusa]SMC44667.1 Protein of unknown function [Sporomusa malonica]HWR06773.1 DUF2922 domain-containing protein [Sporomusa sp.]